MRRFESRHTRGSLLLFCALALFVWTGCSATTSDEPSTAKVPEAEDTGDDVSEKGKKWGGWRWQGDRDNCYFAFKNTCFATQEAACKEAACENDGCQVAEGAPARVSCRE